VLQSFPRSLRVKVDPSLILREVIQNPNVYKEKMVLWGGEIPQTLPQKDGTTLIEILYIRRIHGFMILLNDRYVFNSTY
jgi:hypothetical protein